jgi:hypothetical protein
MSQEFNGILPIKISGMAGTEIRPGIYLITDPAFHIKDQMWTALANIQGMLGLIQLKVWIEGVTYEKTEAVYNPQSSRVHTQNGQQSSKIRN